MDGTEEVRANATTSQADYTEAATYIMNRATHVQAAYQRLITLCKNVENQCALRLYQEEVQQVMT